MKRKNSFVTYIVMIMLIGVISSIISSDMPFGAMFRNLTITGLEDLLEKVSLGLGFVALAGLIGLIFFRSMWMKKDDRIESVWEEHIDQIDD
jgi:hypothetical protein